MARAVPESLRGSIWSNLGSARIRFGRPWGKQDRDPGVGVPQNYKMHPCVDQGRLSVMGDFVVSDYLVDVQRYDAGADAGVVEKIVKHLGIALRSRDASLVSCSDPSELARVREKWCAKKFGETDEAAADAVIARVCETMKGDRQKQRVTFYYLVAKDMGRLGDL